jgi:shikimate kinase
MNLVLIGYRGTGKTSVAQRLGLLLAWPWIDADVEIELRAGKSIRAIFDDDGEAHFRQLESTVLADLLARDGQVIAAGGGVVVLPENRALLARATVVWLTADVDIILARITADPATRHRRPNLTTAGGRDEIAQLLAQREPLYRQCAHFIVDTVGRSTDEIAAEIVERVGLPVQARVDP